MFSGKGEPKANTGQVVFEVLTVSVKFFSSIAKVVFLRVIADEDYRFNLWHFCQQPGMPFFSESLAGRQIPCLALPG